MENKFDIFSTENFSLSEHRFSRICRVDPLLRLIGSDKFIDENGYLGVSINQLEALWISKVLRGHKINACPVAERYKSSLISEQDARQLAKQFVADKRVDKPDYEFEDPEVIPVSWWLSRIAFAYFSKSEKMKRDGISPAGITVCIDRDSGQILAERELINAELQIMLTE